MVTAMQLSGRKHKLFYVQPVLAPYRLPLVRRLANDYELTVFADSVAAVSGGFGDLRPENVAFREAPSVQIMGGRFFYQGGVIPAVVRERPRAVLLFANPRYISCWLLILICRMLGVRTYLHGQGLYSTPNPSLGRRLLYRALVTLGTRYICYAEVSKDSLVAAGCDRNKLEVVDNALELSTTVRPEMRSGKEEGVLFIGRLRPGNRLDELIDAVQEVRKSGFTVSLHVIGGGEPLSALTEKYAGCKWIFWHGAISDEREIARISSDCRIGCYPGDAGLSVVHMFSLSLPPVVHDDVASHMGPEPSYVQDGKNGFLFSRSGGRQALREMLHKVWQMDEHEMKRVCQGAYQSYCRLADPSWSERMALVIDHCHSGYPS